MAGQPSLYNAVVNDAVKPISWLIGRWKTEQGKGYYPTIEPFGYCEEVEFTSIGQPILNYHSYSWHPEKKNPMHLETGFLRIKPGTNELAFMVAHNFGLSVIEEGTVDGTTVVLKTKKINRMSFAKGSAVLVTVRTLSLEGDKLKQVISMATDTQPLTEHLTAIYEKVP
ncbi:peroxynitrite isomerase THAP4-like [Ischnura elegans]|uniref:peroxynitrite isomerase THAP4-like n=1 Tax=Ischnura elegans TaxID=197161 RepID=UPI001ED86661|nr:peroxynitrite isomerase THAP4-like [Ischnura elegans]